MATPKKKTAKKTKKKTAKTAKSSHLCKVEGCRSAAFFGLTTCLAHGAMSLVTSHAEAAHERGSTLGSLLLQVGGSVVAKHAPDWQERVSPYTENLPQPEQRLEPEMVELFGRHVGRQVHARVQQERAKRSTAKQARAEGKQTINPFMVLHLDARVATKADIEAARKHFAKFYHDDKRPPGAQKDAMRNINAAADLCLRYVEKRDAG